MLLLEIIMDHVDNDSIRSIVEKIKFDMIYFNLWIRYIELYIDTWINVYL